jgi:hypothetical protein
MRTTNSSATSPSADISPAFWTQRREASLNWLALGLLLAAWNAVDDANPPMPRPDSLRAHARVTVRAMVRSMDPMRSS